MNIAVVWNASDQHCGFQSFGDQTVTALRRAGHTVVPWDITYPVLHRREEQGLAAFLPSDAASLDVLHVIWHPAFANHLTGATWPHGPVLSLWVGQWWATCPFRSQMQEAGPFVAWCPVETVPFHHWCWYPIPDWVTDLPKSAERFTVGVSGVRRDGQADVEAVCAAHGWTLSASDPAVWLPVEDEVRRLARSTVNVCWLDACDDDRASSPMTMLASRRPLLIREGIKLLSLLDDCPDVYCGADLEVSLHGIFGDWQSDWLRYPQSTVDRYSWRRAVAVLEEGWRDARG